MWLCARRTAGDDSPRDWQLKFASITFHDHLCFYLDSSFCSALRAHNDRFGNVALVGSAVTFSLWASSFLFLLLRTVRFAWLAARNGVALARARLPTTRAARAGGAACAPRARFAWLAPRTAAALARIPREDALRACGVQAVTRAGAHRACGAGLLAGLSRSATEASRWMALNYVCVFFIISPPIFWYKMFLPCIECYDFEATAAHELGHVLGFSHPDIHPAAHHVARRPPSAANCCRRSSAPAGAAYSWMDAANCSSGALQTDAVAFDANDPAISSSIMYHLTTFKSRACLSLNDLHGLLHQYPVCDDALIHQTEPLCVKAKRNIGWARALEAILPPVVFASLVLFITVSLASRIQRQQTSRELWSLAARTALDGSTGPRPREHAAKTPAAGRGLATLGTNDAPTSGARSHASRRDALSSSISTPTHGPHTPLVDAASQAAAVAAAAALTPAPCREPPALEAAHLAQVPPQELMHRTPPSKRLSTGAATRELVARAASQRQARARKLPEPTAGSPAPTQAQSDVLEKWRIYREQSRSARADGGVAHVPPLALRPHPDFLGLRSSVASDGLPRGGAPSAAGGSGSVQPMASSKGTAHAPGRASEEAQLYA